MQKQRLLNLLLNNREEIELKQRPCGILDKFSCTFNSATVPMTLAHSDDNGSYLQKGCPKYLYYVGDSSCVIALCENGTYYINKRSGTKYQRFMLIVRKYTSWIESIGRRSKIEPSFKCLQLLVELIRKILCRTTLCLTDGTTVWEKNEKTDFVVSRHGNAKHPRASTYYRQNPILRQETKDKLSNGVPSGKTYRDLVKQAEVK